MQGTCPIYSPPPRHRGGGWGERTCPAAYQQRTPMLDAPSCTFLLFALCALFARGAARIAPRGDADEPLEVACEVALVAEARQHCDLRQRHARREQPLGSGNPQLGQIGMWRQPCLALEDTQQVERTQ